MQQLAALLAVDPAGLGGIVLRCADSATAEQWLRLLQAHLPEGSPLRRIPSHVDETALLGGLDLSGTLQAGRPVVRAGLLAQTDGGLAVIAGARRLSAAMAARLAQVLDRGEVVVERTGASLRSPARMGLVVLDAAASAEDDAPLPATLLDRLAFHVHQDGAQADFRALLEDAAPPEVPAHGVDQVLAARQRLRQVVAGDTVIQALCATALALGVDSPRAPLLALRVARAAAALDGRLRVDDNDAALAAGLVLAPRATRQPAPADEAAPAPTAEEPADAGDAADADADAGRAKGSEPEAASPPPGSDGSQDANGPTTAQSPPSPEAPESPESSQRSPQQALDDTVLQAAQAAIPAGLLATLQSTRGTAARTPSRGAGAQQNAGASGRPIGTRRSPWRAGERLHLLDTLRAAAPWQGLRQREDVRAPAAAPEPGARARFLVRREDFHVSRFRQRSAAVTIFAVDASGSSALHRLAEAKGAVELLLMDCYVRRDRVAVLAFRGRSAELLLPPTRSLTRAKRSLAVLPGGGGTPLAAGLEMARELGRACQQRGETPLVVVLTDGHANIDRAGHGGRESALRDALAAARSIRAAALTGLLLDTSPRPQPGAARLAEAMGARYLPLPHADANRLSQAVRAAGTAAQPR